MQLLGNNFQIDYKKIRDEASDFCSTQKKIFTEVIPWMVVSSVFLGMAQQALISPAEQVAFIASRVMYGALACSFVKGISSIIKVADSEEFDEGEIKIKKNEFQKMLDEISDLRQKLLVANTKIHSMECSLKSVS